MKSWVNKRVENWILKHLLNAITLKDIIGNDLKTKALIIDGKLPTQNELNQLNAEIKALEGFRIWRLMSETTKHLAEERIFSKSVDIEDIRSGKAMLYNLSLQKSILIAIKSKGMV